MSLKIDKPIRKMIETKSGLTYVNPDDPLAKALFIHTLENIGGKKRIERIYVDMVTNHEQADQQFWSDALKKFELNPIFDETQLAKVPQEGPLIFVANHPFGLADGIILGYLAHKARGPFKAMLHSLLCRGEEMFEDYTLPVNFDATKEALRETVQSKKMALKHLKNGGSMIIFPAGNVSTSINGWGPAYDFEWRLFTAKMIQMSRATVVPVYFEGQNSRLFQVGSHMHYLLRAGLFLREFNRIRNRPIPVAIGDPIPYSDIEHLGSRQEMMTYLRQHVYDLGNRPNAPLSTAYWDAEMT